MPTAKEKTTTTQEFHPIPGVEPEPPPDVKDDKKKDVPVFPCWVYNAEGDSMVVNSQEEWDTANETGDWRASPADFSEAEVAAAAHPIAAANTSGVWDKVQPSPEKASAPKKGKEASASASSFSPNRP